MSVPRLFQFLVAALLFAGLTQGAFADDITQGTFDISGTIYLTSAQATPVVTPAGTCPANTSCIFWQNSSGTTDGEVDISAAGLPNGNIPAAISGNDAANVASLTNPTAGSTSVPFMTFNDGGVTTALTLTEILPGIFSSSECTLAPAVGEICTPSGSPFNFVNNPPSPGQATMSWVFEGTTATAGVTWFGNFTSQFNTPYQTVLSDLATNGYVDSSFSADISLTGPPTTDAPEPGTIGLLLTGIGSLLFLRRRAFQTDFR